MDCHLFVQKFWNKLLQQPSKTTDQQNSANLTGTTNHFYLLITVDDDDLVSNCRGAGFQSP
jgi:hypothetical protein